MPSHGNSRMNSPRGFSSSFCSINQETLSPYSITNDLCDIKPDLTKEHTNKLTLDSIMVEPKKSIPNKNNYSKIISSKSTHSNCNVKNISKAECSGES